MLFRSGCARLNGLVDAGAWQEAKELGADYLGRYPECNPLQILYAKTLLGSKDYDGCLGFLADVTILPSEFGDDATGIWQSAQKAKGLEPTWPEQLGKGDPRVQ